MRDLRVYGKADEKEAVAKYGITPVETKWVDTDNEKRSREKPMQIRSRMCARGFKSDDRPDLYAGTPAIGGAESNNIDRSSEPQGNVFNHAH